MLFNDLFEDKNPSGEPFLRAVKGKCKICGKPAEYLLSGISTKKRDKELKLLGADCKHCNFKVKAKIEDVNKLFNIK